MKNQLNGLLGLLGTTTFLFTATPVFAQTTNVPFIGGRINFTADNTGILTFNDVTGVTPLGTAVFTGGSNITFRNNTQNTGNAITGVVGDDVSFVGTTNGSFSVTSNGGSSFTFTNAPATTIGKILTITPPGISRTLDTSITGGSIALPTSQLNLVPTSGATNIPFIGGNLDIDVSNSGGITFKSASALTPLGNISFNSFSANQFRNLTTNTINSVTASATGNLISLTGISSGTFAPTGTPTANGFSTAPTTIFGTIKTLNLITSGTNLTSTIDSGIIQLPNAVIGRSEVEGFKVLSGGIEVTTDNAFKTINVKFNNLVTSGGVINITQVNFSTILAEALSYKIQPGEFTPYIPPSSANAVQFKPISIGGLISGNFNYIYGVNGIQTINSINVANATYAIEGIINISSESRIDIVVRSGSIFFPVTDIRNTERVATEQVQKQQASEAIQNTRTETEAGVVTTTVNTPSPSAVATSTVHPDVNNRNPIDVKADQSRVNSATLLSQSRTSDAFASIEGSLGSQLSSFTGRNSTSPSLSLNQSLEEMTRWSGISSSPTAAVYPVILKDRLEILVLLPEIVASASRKASPARSFRTSVPVPQEALSGLIEKFRDNLQDPSSSDYLKEARVLYDILIRPIEAELQTSGISTLVFAMDGDLRSIPVAALYDGEKFLVQKYASATVPSLQLANVSSRKRNTDVSILAVGLTDSVQGFSALPNVKTEVDIIGSKILSGTSFFNQDFTVDNIQAQRRKQPYNIIHLATHAQFDLDNANDSFILFWDRKVRTNQLPKLDLSNIELLTLSACETAVGNNLGLSGSAISAGVKTVLASLWSVSDAGTAPLMIKFYSNYVDAPSKAIALQKAQLALIDGSVKIENNVIKGIPNIGDIATGNLSQKIDLKHPFFWSPFILVGNWL